MKIRITKKGLPKAQMWNSIINGSATQDQNGLVWGSNPLFVTQAEMQQSFGQCGPGMVFSEMQQKCVSQQEADAEKNALQGFSTFMDRRRKGLPTNAFKTTGNEGTASNPMNASSIDTPAGRKMLYNNQYYDQAGANTIGANMMKGLKPFGSRKEIKGFVSDYNDAFGTDYKVPFMTADRMKLAKKVSKVGDYALMASAAVDYASQIKKAKDWQNTFKQNMYDLPSAAEDEGNHTTNLGIFQPNLLPSPNEGMFADGGTYENNNTMKIRIIAGPKRMAYGGQSDYGLDLGQRNVYTDMPEGKSESVSSTITGVPRYQANIEAEGGETLYGDVDGDGVNEHMKISGPRHSEGGVPLDAPEGSFIFSDTKKMRIKDPEVLAMFGMSFKKGGVTPAMIAKKYDVNKYKAILEDPNADDLSKSTAQMMVKNYQDKLGRLAMVQEEMKGFPQGIPQVAEGLMEANEAMAEMAYGGYFLPKAQKGAQKKGSDVIFTPEFQKILADLKAKQNVSMIYSPRLIAGDNQVPNWQNRNAVGLYGDITRAEMDEFKKRHNWYFKDRPNWNFKKKSDVEDFQRRYDNEYAKKHGYSYFTEKRGFDKIDGKPGEYTYNAPGLEAEQKPQEDPGVKYKCGPNGVVAVPGNQPTGGGYFNITEPLFDKYEDALAACTAKEKPKEDPKKDLVKPNENSFKGNEPTPFGYMTPDLVNLYANAAIPPSLTMGFRPKASFESGKYFLEDWLTKAQQRQQTYNTTAQTLGTFGPASGLAANLSFMAGQTGDGVTADVAGVNSRNTDRANVASTTERQRKDQNTLFNLAQSQELWRDNAIAKQQFDNARRNYLRDIAKSYSVAWNNRMNLGLLNATNPMYNIDNVSGRSYFKRGWDASKLGTMGNGVNGDWASIGADFMNARRESGINDLTFDQYLKLKGYSTTSDKNGDGIPDQTTRRATAAAFGGYVTYPF